MIINQSAAGKSWLHYREKTLSSSDALESMVIHVFTGIVPGMGSANERRGYKVKLSLISFAHTQNDLWSISIAAAVDAPMRYSYLTLCVLVTLHIMVT